MLYFAHTDYLIILHKLSLQKMYCKVKRVMVALIILGVKERGWGSRRLKKMVKLAQSLMEDDGIN